MLVDHSIKALRRTGGISLGKEKRQTRRAAKVVERRNVRLMVISALTGTDEGECFTHPKAIG